jgi:Leucine-rich repeat (LRR) protein
MPTSLENFFPHLSVLQIWSCGMKKLSQSDISAHQNLHELSMSGNEIETLDSNLFEKNAKISKIDFSRNRLKNVGFNLLLPLERLIFADFYGNDCISDGSRSVKSVLIANLRKFCQPSGDMLMTDIRALNDELVMLRTELKTCEKIHRNRRCDDESEKFVALDSLFPFFYANEENRIE